MDGTNKDDGLRAVLYVGLAKRNNNNQASLQKVEDHYQMHMKTDEAGFAFFVSILALQKVTIHGETVVIQFDDCSESTQTTIKLIV